jgi:hypothetical protein
MSLKTNNSRKKLYLQMNKLLKNVSTEQCLVPIENNNKHMYDIANAKLTLKKQIGTDSKYGVVYLTQDKTKKKLVTKLTPINFRNNFEINISKKLANFVLKDLTPHFLLIYKVLACFIKNEDVPNIIKNDYYYMSINELADGDFYNFLDKNYDDYELINNALQQVLLCVLSFHYFSGGLYHRDCHGGNFLFHKIKPGGYFKYEIFGKTIYVKNLGFLWMIWDFGLVKTKKEDKKIRLADYFRIIGAAIKYYTVKEYYYDDTIKSFFNLFNLKNNFEELLGKSDKKFFENYLFKSSLYLTSIPDNSKIINKKPYVINDFN